MKKNRGPCHVIFYRIDLKPVGPGGAQAPVVQTKCACGWWVSATCSDLDCAKLMAGDAFAEHARNTPQV